MSLLPRSIALRLSLAFVGLAVIVFVALGFYLGRAADAHMAELDQHELLGKLALVRHVAAQAGDPQSLDARLSDALVGEHGLALAIDGGGQALFRWPENAATEALALAAIPPGIQPTEIEAGGRRFRAVAGEGGTGWGQAVRVRVARDIAHHTEFLDRMQRDFWLAVIAAAILTALLGAVIARHGMGTVRDIARTAGKISAGSLAERLPEAGVPAELLEMVRAFNAMLARLEDSFARLSDFSADLAHELRTPIHSLRMQTEVSLSKARTADQYRELLASSLEEYDSLARMIGDMLFLAKADHGLVIPQREAVPLLALGRQLAEYYGVLAEERALTVVGDEIIASGDRGMLQRALGNLLGNALRHAPPGGWVEMSIGWSPDEATVTIANSGSPIPADQLSRIFERFVRLEGGGEGSGLGLAISRSIVHAHGGRIEVTSDDVSTRFAVVLPSSEERRAG